MVYLPFFQLGTGGHTPNHITVIIREAMKTQHFLCCMCT